MFIERVKMKKLFVLFSFILLSFLIVPGAPSYADEAKLRENFQIEIADLFWKRKFSELEARSSLYRKSQSRTPSGFWELDLMYYGLRNVISSSSVSDGEWEKVFKILDEWIDMHPDSPSAHITKAAFLEKFAWKIRGHSFAKDVPKEAWGTFFGALKIAEDYLNENKDIASQDPEWYARMLSILGGSGSNSMAYERVLKEGLDKYPNYYGIYNVAVLYLLPQWRGDKHQIEDFANEAVERSQQTDGMAMYARIYWGLSQTQYKAKLFRETDASWPKMRQGFRDILKKYPDPRNQNSFAFFSCAAKDKETLKELLDKIDTPLIYVWYTQDYYDFCKNFAASTD
ncbi:MAG TPA: DUF4034 domain-containing protein [Alphaproteobacteria bacterium]|nr:DUF4034 domain-containing protein [Alphaproteobacteria bacterium]